MVSYLMCYGMFFYNGQLNILFRIMKYEHNDIFTAIKSQFNRKCANSQTMLSRIADDFIHRYSLKNNPNPEFFKEDSTQTLNQFTLYSDQCVRVMKTFEFLQPAAVVIESITTSLLKLNNFLSKHLYHLLNESTQIPINHHNNLSQQLLCLNCAKLKQTQRLKSIKQVLHINQFSLLEYKKMNDMINHCLEEENHEVYDAGSFQAMNEEGIRNRLIKMEVDHDKRKRDMIICLEELNRAQQNIMDYGKVVGKKGDQFSDKFNVKDYIFKLSRHFCHNISSLDYKIKQLKNLFNPTLDTSCQTQKQFIQLPLHLSKMSILSTELSQLKHLLAKSNTNYANQSNKSRQLQERLAIIEARYFQNQICKQQQSIENKIVIENLKKTLANIEKQSNQLKSKMKEIINFRKVVGSESEKSGKSILTQQFLESVEQVFIDNEKSSRSSLNSAEKCDTLGSLNKINSLEEKSDELRPKKLRTMQSFLKYERIETNHQRSSSRKTLNQDQNIKIIKKIQNESKNNGNNWLISQTVNQHYIPVFLNKAQMRYSLAMESRQFFFQNSEKQQNRHSEMQQKRFSKCERNLFQIGKVTLKQRSSEIPELDLKSIRQKQQRKESIVMTNINSFNKTHKKKSKIALNTIYHLHPEKSKIKELGLLKENMKATMKKRRNFSQQNSIQQYQTNDQMMKGNLKQIKEIKDKFLGDKQRKLLLFDELQGLKIMRNYFNRMESSRIILSLQEINYSTYLYSVIANLHAKNYILYESVLKFIVNLFPNNGEPEASFKESVNYLLMMHRKCKSGAVCQHLQLFLCKIKSL